MRFRFTFILLLAVGFLQAQLTVPSEQHPVFKQVTHPFMPPITSACFFFSEDGLMWFSTASGLTSFDGSDIIYHSSLKQANDLGLGKINAMAEDKEHNFYITTSVGVYYYNRIRKSYKDLSYIYTDTRQPFNLGFTALFLDKNGIIYIGSGNGGLFIYDPSTTKITHYNLDRSQPDSWQSNQLNTIFSFAPHAIDSNKLWVGTFHGIFLFDKRTKTFSQNFQITTDIRHKYNLSFGIDDKLIDVQKMEVTNDSIIMFNSWAGGFVKYNCVTGKGAIVFGRDALYKAKGIYYGYIIPRFVRLSGDNYLLGIYNGKTAVFNSRTGTAEYFNVTQDDYPEAETRYVTNDRKGNVWLLQRGLIYISVPDYLRLKYQTVPILTATKFAQPKIQGLYFDSTSRLYYGAFLSSTGIHVYDSNFTLKKILPTSIINNFYNYGSSIDTKIVKDGSGRFWTTGWKCHVLLPGKNEFLLVEKIFPSLAWLGKEDEFNNVIVTRDGNLLFKNRNGTIYTINHTTLHIDSIKCPAMEASGAEVAGPSVFYDNKRDIIYLTRGEGMAQYNRVTQQIKIIPHNSLFGNSPVFLGVCNPALDATGRLWITIPKYGIRIIDPVSLLCIDSIQYGLKGLMQGDYTSILGGAGDYMLFRSQNGIVVYDFKKQQSFLFDHTNGLSGPDNKAFLYCNGYMIISHSGRFEYYKLSDLDNYLPAIVPSLNTIVSDTSAIFIRTNQVSSSAIKVLHSQNTLTFSFSAPDFFFPERIEYAYQLAPLDKDWHYTNYFNRKVSYVNLAPGEYTFRLKAQRQGGNWDMPPVEYSIIISPAWWQSIWFRMIAGIAVIAGIVYFNRRRIQSIRKKEQQKTIHEKELLELESRALRAQMNPHFIFNSLNSIKSLINKNENDKAATYLTTFSKLIRTLFQNSDKREISLYEELETCRYYTQIERMRFGDKVSFIFDIDPALDLKDIKVPALVLQPFIENAIWHGLMPKESGGEVIVSVKETDGTVECKIDDNGIGREMSEQYKMNYISTHESKGIGLTQSRLQLDKLLNDREDSVLIIDKKDNAGMSAGTTVIVSFKEINK